MTFSSSSSNIYYDKVQQEADHDLDDSLVMVHRPVVEVVTGGEEDDFDAANNRGTSQPSTPSSCWNTTRCAGCIGATAGCFTMGPCLAVICATGCMYCAKTQQEHVGGDIARACGNMGVQANVMIRDLDEEHHLWERSQQLASSTWRRTKDINDEYQISQKAKSCLVSTVKAGVEFTKEHKLVERTTQGMGKVLAVVANEVVTPSLDSNNDTNAATRNAVEEAFSDPEIYATGEEIV